MRTLRFACKATLEMGGRARLSIVLSVDRWSSASIVLVSGASGERLTGSQGRIAVDVSGLRPGHVIPVHVSLPGRAAHEGAGVRGTRDRGLRVALGWNQHVPGVVSLALGDPTYGIGFIPDRKIYFEDPCFGPPSSVRRFLYRGPCPRGA